MRAYPVVLVISAVWYIARILSNDDEGPYYWTQPDIKHHGSTERRKRVST